MARELGPGTPPGAPSPAYFLRNAMLKSKVDDEDPMCKTHRPRCDVVDDRARWRTIPSLLPARCGRPARGAGSGGSKTRMGWTPTSPTIIRLMGHGLWIDGAFRLRRRRTAAQRDADPVRDSHAGWQASIRHGDTMTGFDLNGLRGALSALDDRTEAQSGPLTIEPSGGGSPMSRAFGRCGSSSRACSAIEQPSSDQAESQLGPFTVIGTSASFSRLGRRRTPSFGTGTSRRNHGRRHDHGQRHDRRSAPVRTTRRRNFGGTDPERHDGRNDRLIAGPSTPRRVRA